MTELSRQIRWQTTTIDQRARKRQLGQTPFTVWFTGLSGSGKSATANALERQLFERGYLTYLLDGDNVRHGLCGDLGFSRAERSENIRRVGEVARLMVDAGLIVIASFISPFRQERDSLRQLLGRDAFIECYMQTPLAVCEQRDPKGLYQQARNGKLQDFTGIDSPYEAPQDPELLLDASDLSCEENAALVIKRLTELGLLAANRLRT